MSSVMSEIELKSPVERTGADDDTDAANASSANKQLHFRTYKNLFVLCVAFLLQFTAFGAIGNLQSSLNTAENVGVNSLSIIYGCLIVSAIFLPHPLMTIFGIKWTLVISQIP